MEIDDTTKKFNQIFNPGLLERLKELEEENKRFVYYTSSETAMKILENKELWFRDANVMNDTSEISYGLELLRKVFGGPEGKRFKEAIEDIFVGTANQVDEAFLLSEQDWQMETYICCVSVHDTEEDIRGRLSMWRAYGDTALVVKNTPLVASTNLLGVYSTPVRYFTELQLTNHIASVTDAILINRGYLKKLGQETLVLYIHAMLFQFAIATKHPGFKEENEWRLYYRPNQQVSSAMSEDIVVLDGVPQIVYKLDLANKPEIGLFEADIPSLVDRIIIGPTDYPYVSYKAFVSMLTKLKVKDAATKVVVSDIPLRSR